MEISDLYNALIKKESNALYVLKQAQILLEKKQIPGNRKLVQLAQIRVNHVKAALENLKVIAESIDAAKLIELKMLEATVLDSVSKHDTVDDWYANNRNSEKYESKWDELVLVLRGWVHPHYIVMTNAGWIDACMDFNVPFNYTFSDLINNKLTK